MSLALAGYFPWLPMPAAPQPRPVPPKRFGRHPVDLRGQVFGELLAVEPSGRVDKRGQRWACKCLRCGAMAELRTDHLQDESRPRTCGCAPSARRMWKWWQR